MENTFLGKINENYLGATTVRNTTFPELVKMVKDDCEQFKDGYTDYTGYEHLSDEEKDEQYYEVRKKNLGWTFTPAEASVKETVLIRNRYSKYHGVNAFTETYGDIYKMTDEELIKLDERIKKEGVDKKAEKELQGYEAYSDFVDMSDEQNKKMVNTYGEWRNLSYDEMFQLRERILKDMDEGRFSWD